MRTFAVVTLMASLFAVPAFAGREPSYAEKMACQHMLEFLKDADEILGKMPLENYTTSVGTRSIEAPITRSKQEMSRCPKGTPDIAIAEERIATLRAAVAAKTEEAKALAPGAKKVTAAVKVWLGKLEAAKKSEPMAFQDPGHKSVVWLRDDLDGIEKKLVAAGNPEHPDAKEAAAAVADAKAKLQAALDDAKKAVESLGNWQAKAKELGDKLDGRYMMHVPIDDAKVDAWIDLLPESKADLVAAEALKTLVHDTVKDVDAVPAFKELSDKVWAEKNVFERETTNWYGNFINDISLAESTPTDFKALNIGIDGFDDPRRRISNGISAAKHKEKYLRVFLKDEAAAAQAADEVKTYEARMAALDATEEKLLDSVRMPRPRGTPEMQKIMKQVISSSDFVKQMKSEGNKVLRVMVIEDSITHTKTTEWYHGRWYTRDFDSFTCLAAMKDDRYHKVWKWQFDARFARTELPELKTGVWTYGSWQRFGPILEANVNK